MLEPEEQRHPHLKESVRRELCSYISVSYFDSSSIDVFREEIKQQLRNAMSKSVVVEDSQYSHCSFNEQNNGYFYPYDSNIIEYALRPTLIQTGINWFEICSNHDELDNETTAIPNSKTKYDGSKNTIQPHPAPKRGKRRRHNTTLEEVLQIFLNPTVIPYCCSTTLVLALLRILVFVPRKTLATENINSTTTKSSPSQDLILDTIVKIIKRCPNARPKFADFFRDEMQLPAISSTPNVSLLNEFDCQPLTQLVSTMRNLSKSCPSDRLLGASVMQCLIEAVKSVDDVDIELLQTNSRGGTHGRCLDCHLPLPTKTNIAENSPKRQRRSKFSTISNLHDTNFISEVDDTTSGMILQSTTNISNHRIERISRPKATLATSKQISIEKLMLMKTPEKTCACHTRKYGPLVGKLNKKEKQRQPDFTKLSSDMVFLRCKIYRKIVSTFILLTMSCNVDQRNRYSYDADNVPRRELDPSNLWLLRDFLHKCYMNPQSPSVRLCVILLADSVGDTGYNFIVKRLWQLYGYQQGLNSSYSPKAELVLRIYSEILVECSTFDNGNLCWGGLRPLLNCIQKICDETEETDNKNNVGNVDGTQFARIRPILRCVSYVIRHRSNVLLHSSHEKSFRQFLAQMSVSFHDQKWWVSPSMSTVEQEDILYTLQALGILSFVEYDGDGQSVEKIERPHECGMTGIFDTCMHWPFRGPLSLRSTHQRMGPHCGNKDLLSSVKNSFESFKYHKKNTSEAKSTGRPDDQHWVLPIMDYLHDDVLHHILSFMNYKRLIQVRSVCKAWRSLADSNMLWHQLYMSRHNVDGTLILPASANQHGPVSWKTFFINKWYIDRELKFRRSSSGFKHRVCGYIDCECILKTQAQQQKHYATHAKKIEMARERAKLAEQKKREKEEKAEAAKKQKMENARLRKQILQKKKEEKAANAAEVKKKLADEREWLRVVKLEEKKWEDEIKQKEIQKRKEEKAAKAAELKRARAKEQEWLRIVQAEEKIWEEEVKQKKIEMERNASAKRDREQDSSVDAAFNDGRKKEDGSLRIVKRCVKQQNSEGARKEDMENKIAEVKPNNDTNLDSEVDQIKDGGLFLQEVEQHGSTDSTIDYAEESRGEEWMRTATMEEKKSEAEVKQLEMKKQNDLVGMKRKNHPANATTDGTSTKKAIIESQANAIKNMSS